MTRMVKKYMMVLDPIYVDFIVKRYIGKVGSDADVYLLRGNQNTAYQDAINN